MGKSLSLPPLPTMLIIVWAVAAFALRSVIPWFFWTTMFCLPATVLIRQEWLFLRSRPGQRILMICAVMFISHVIWAFARSQNYDAAQTGTYWKDDHGYYSESTAIAESWRIGVYPEIWRKGASPYLGTLHTGYHRPLSLLFLITGPSTLAGLLLNAFCAALLPLMAALCSRYLWLDRREIEDVGAAAKPFSKDVVLLTALLCAIHPNQFYWASYLMKDMYVAFIFLTTMALMLGAIRRKNMSMAVATVFILPYFFTVRIYSALSLVVGATLLPALQLRKRIIISLATGVAIVLFLACAYTYTGNRLYEQIRDSFVALAPAGVEHSSGLIKHILVGIPRLFLGPYAWLRLETPTPMVGLFPGMWFLYILGYPLAFAGLYAALRRNVKLAIIPLAAFGLAALLFLTAAYGGNASRQRYYLEYVILIFAAYGIVHPSRWWIGGILIVEAVFAIGQVMSLEHFRI